ncbi:MAG: S8 family serine peptidase [Nocardioides sp.]
MSSNSPRPHRRGLAATAAAVLTLGMLTSTAGTADAAATPDRKAPLLGTGKAGAIDGRYIVVMEGRASSADARAAVSKAKAEGASDVDRFSTVEGFSAELSDAAVATLREDADVAYIEADQRLAIDTTQSPATWGLDRIDQRNRPLNNAYTYTPTGSGVTAYIIDTGVRASHNEFGGRVGSGFSAINDGRGTNDCNGHGTHVAGTVGGTTYGVAKQVTIRPVRVLDCNGSGTTSGVIAGIDWVTGNHSAGNPAVANMSLGGGVSSALDTAVNNSIADGVTYAVAAGNDNANACNGSPSRVGAALTVGSTTSTDARSSFSNYGSCLDIFAPGSSITSAWYTSNTATNTISGTSMATPHVAGVAALYLQGNPSASPSAVGNAIISTSTSGVVSNPGSGSPNRLLYSRLSGGDNPPPPTGNLLQNPGFESGATAWSATSGVITNASGVPARSGSWKAWLNGYGRTSTDTLSQNVAVPSGATLSFYLYISSAETTTSIAYDRLQVQVVSNGTTTTLGTFSNLNEGPSYVQRSFNLSAYAGRTVTIRFVGNEDSSLATSFVIDDTAVATG